MSNIVELRKVNFNSAIIVEKVSQEDEKTVTYQLRQTVGLEYIKGNSTPKFEGGIDLFDEEDTQVETYDSVRVCWQKVPKRKFPTIESFQSFINLKLDYFIQEVYGLNPIGMNQGYNYALEKGNTTLEKIISSNLKMKGPKDDLSPTFVEFRNERVPLYSMKQLASSKSFGDKKMDADNCVASLHGGKYSPLLIDVEEEEIMSEDIIGVRTFE
jgi:hypothetical protein